MKETIIEEKDERNEKKGTNKRGSYRKGNKGKGRREGKFQKGGNPLSVYFKDAAQAEILSRIQMNAFGSITKLEDDKVPPTIMTMYTNPCPGVTALKPRQNLSDVTPFTQFQIRGINRAAQKLWYKLTAKSGRSASYTKSSVALLLLAFQGMIEVYEFIRRVFGIAWTYNQRNRSYPTLIWNAMGIDYDDFRANAANYLKRMNTLMATMNQLPIPGGVAAYTKSMIMFKKLWMDYVNEMSQIYMFCPSTTWYVEENDGFAGGAYLKTEDMCLEHSSQNIGIAYGGSMTTVSREVTVAVATRTLGYYIDIFEKQINNLLFSSTFSVIYSDLLRASEDGRVTLLSFDYIDENYEVKPDFSDEILAQIHNCKPTFGFSSVDRLTFQNGFDVNDYQETFAYGTPLNDVYDWAPGDVLIYNPALVSSPYDSYQSSFKGNDNIVVDFDSINPGVEMRVESTRYMGVPFNDVQDYLNRIPGALAATQPSYVGDVIGEAINWELPDHWIDWAVVTRDESSQRTLIIDGTFNNSTRRSQLSTAYTAVDNNMINALVKFHHAPYIRLLGGYAGLDSVYSNPGRYAASLCIGELDSWTYVQRRWFKDINQMIYVDMYDI